MNATMCHQCLWFVTPPRLSLALRAVAVAGFLLLAVWGEDLPTLLGGAVGCLVFRWLCCHDLTGITGELRGAGGFTLLVVVLAVPSGTGDLIGLGIRTGLRFFLFFSPAATFSRCLYPREGMHALQGLLPGGLLLSLEVALRFLPLLVREAGEVLMVQRCRGAFRRGSWVARLQALLFPFFCRLFHMADRVTFALRARGVDAARPRALVSPEAVRQVLATLRRKNPCPN